MKTLLSALVLALACSCGAAPPAVATTGTAQLRFAISSDAKSDANLKDPLKGNFYGEVYLQEDVGITGPRDDATAIQEVTVENIDLTAKAANEPADATFVTNDLPPGHYVVLGFFDVDANGATSKSPDPGDPVTLALTNKFDIAAATQTKRLTLFELIYN